MSSTSPSPRRRASGFTLLEVMCALALLGLMTGTVTIVCTQAVATGSKAIDLRELREAADTVFRRVCYEDGKHADGMTSTLDNFYAAWADIKSGRDRWKIYGMELRRKIRTAAGTAVNDSESLFGSGSSSTNRHATSSSGSSSGSGTSRTSGSGTSGTTGTSTSGTTATPENSADTGVNLVDIRVRIFLVDEPQNDLFVLQTYQRAPPTDQTGASSSSSGTGTSGTGTSGSGR